MRTQAVVALAFCGIGLTLAIALVVLGVWRLLDHAARRRRAAARPPIVSTVCTYCHRCSDRLTMVFHEPGRCPEREPRPGDFVVPLRS